MLAVEWDFTLKEKSNMAALITTVVGFFVFLLFISFTDNTGQAEFFFCIAAGGVAALVTWLKLPAKLKSKG